MKKFLLLLLICFTSMPAFCVPGYEYQMQKQGGTQFYDDFEVQEYGKKLTEEFYKKYTVVVSPTKSISIAPEGAYTNEASIPISEFMTKQQKEGKPGFQFY